MKISTKCRAISLAPIGVMLIGLSINAQADKQDIGKREYDSTCADCHGLTGKGDDGPLKPYLVKPVPNLTVLAKNNKGVFPFDKVFQIIDGRQEVAAHGPRNMPVWGNAFNNQTSLFYDNYPEQDKRRRRQSKQGGTPSGRVGGVSPRPRPRNPTGSSWINALLHRHCESPAMHC